MKKKNENPLLMVKALVEKYPEISWLTGNIQATPEASLSMQEKGTFGTTIFPHLERKDVSEFDRTVVGILALHWVLNGDYESFTACQQGPEKLSLYSFAELVAYTRSVLQTPEDVEAMETFMVINDLGKVQSVIDMTVEKTGIKDVDHDVILLDGLLKFPEVFPSFEKLPPQHMAKILHGLETKFNIGQFIQAENVPASLENLKGVTEENLNFYLLHALFDIAGAAGQAVQNGSVVMNEPTCKNFYAAIAGLNQIPKGQSVKVVYDLYLDFKSALFGLSIILPTERAITRICCMLRISNSMKAKEVFDIFHRLPKNTKAILERELNINGTGDDIATLIYYAPAFLLNLKKWFADNVHDNSFEKALTLGLTVLARVFSEARMTRKEKGVYGVHGVYTVMASSLAKIAADDPEKLSTHDIELTTVGNDAEINLVETPKINEYKFSPIINLSEIPGERIAVIGVGGGSDCIQAALLAGLLQKVGKKCPYVVSIRSGQTRSQSIDGAVNEKRLLTNHGGEIFTGVYSITPETTGSGRFLENIPTVDIPVYLVIEQEVDMLSEQLSALLENIGNIDTVIAVDTGGDALYSIRSGHDEAKATPDQDLRSIEAISTLNIYNILTCVIAPGIDTPPDGEDILRKSSALYFKPSEDEVRWILGKYKEWQMDGQDETRFGKTPLTWQAALNGESGFVSVNLPTRVVLDENNPWIPFVNIQSCTQGMFFMRADDHLLAIGSN